MNRTDRLTGILLALRAGQQTAAELAARFDVSRRTILRDMDALGELGVPVIALPGAGGGFALPEDYWLPPLRLTGAEAAALLLGLAALGPAGASPFGEPRRTAEEKLRAVITADTLRQTDAALRHVAFDPGHAPAPLPVYVDALWTAIAADRWLRIAYRSARRRAEHDILPLRVVSSEGRWYVDAISRGARERRRYRIDRIDHLQPALTPPDADAIRRDADRTVPDYHDANNPELVFHVTDAGVVRAPDLFGASFTPRSLGTNRWEIRFPAPPAEIPFYARCVLTLGRDGRAVAPPELVERVRETAHQTLANHADADPESAAQR